jgi:hypothetical protein
MHSLPHRHLLEHLGSLYGSGKLHARNGGPSHGAAADETGDHGETDRLSLAVRSAPARISGADAPINTMVLDDPRRDAGAAMMVRGRIPD